MTINYECHPSGLAKAGVSNTTMNALVNTTKSNRKEIDSTVDIQTLRELVLVIKKPLGVSTWPIFPKRKL